MIGKPNILPPSEWIWITCVVFVLSFLAMTAVCTDFWETHIKHELYYCTDEFGYDYLFPGAWVHHPVSVDRIVAPKSMSEPDTIKTGWSEFNLWLLWLSFVAGSLLMSGLIALLPGHKAGLIRYWMRTSR